MTYKNVLRHLIGTCPHASPLLFVIGRQSVFAFSVGLVVDYYQLNNNCVRYKFRNKYRIGNYNAKICSSIYDSLVVPSGSHFSGGYL